jgi:hypothetical protein
MSWYLSVIRISTGETHAVQNVPVGSGWSQILRTGRQRTATTGQAIRRKMVRICVIGLSLTYTPAHTGLLAALY